MITFLDTFLKSIFSVHQVRSIREDDILFECTIEATRFDINNNISNLIVTDFLKNEDELTFIITINEGDPISMYSTNLDVPGFIINLNDTIESIEDIDLKILAEFWINKKKLDDKIFIYSLSTFESTLNNKTIDQVFFSFSRAFGESERITFVCNDIHQMFGTHTITFLPDGQQNLSKASIDRKKRIENMLSVSNYTSIKNHTLIPDDFSVTKTSSAYSRLCIAFNNLSYIFSIIYLFDVTSLEGNDFEYAINGYKSKKGNFVINHTLLDGYKDYFKIYEWVYTGGNLNDKIGLARNIITLHFIQDKHLELQNQPFESIQSGYKVYEKQNIKQYIEIRNKVSEQLLDISNKTSKLAENFAVGLQKNILAFITFFFSVFLVKASTKSDMKNIFTFDVLVLTLVFISLSFIYFVYTMWDVKKQKERFIDSYNNLRTRYTDLLNEEDIKKLLNNDKDFKSDELYISNLIQFYQWAVATIHVILIMVASSLYLLSNL